MQWLMLDTKLILADSVFRKLLDTKGGEGAYCRFECMLSLAKEAADLDPDTWQGHLVGQNGRALGLEDLARSYPYSGRDRVRKMQEAVSMLLDFGILRLDSGRNCWQICDWFRWFYQSQKSSTVRVRKWREARKNATNETLPKQHEKRTYTEPNRTIPTPLPPQGERQAGLDVPPEGPEPLDPVEPLDPAEAELMQRPASTDKSKLSAFITLEQQRKLRQRCSQALQSIDPVLGSRARDKLFKEFLEVKPPTGYKFTPQHWATTLAETLEVGVGEVKESQKTRPVKYPADLALSIASRLVGEALSEYAA